jgi:hypothetical protein
MAINPQYVNDDRGQDEIVSNQRVRAYVPGTPGVSSVGGAGSFGTMWMQGTGVPTSFASGSQTYTAVQIGGGLIVHANAGAVNGTLDSTVNLFNYMQANSAGVAVGDIWQCQVFNTGSGILTIVAGDANTTFDANGISTIAAGVSKTLNIRCTSTVTPTLKVYM